jgi:hypothetical protein
MVADFIKVSTCMYEGNGEFQCIISDGAIITFADGGSLLPQRYKSAVPMAARTAVYLMSGLARY